MSTERKSDETKFARAIFNLAHGESVNGDISPDEVRADLKEAGVKVDRGWKEARRLLDAAAGRLKLEEARKARLAAVRTATTVVTNETRESVVSQIRRLLVLDGGATVYARKWEEGALDDLKSLRDQLVHTAEREAKRKNAC